MAGIFNGAGVAIVTPFYEGGVNWDVLGCLVDRQLEAGVSAIIVIGTTGEAATMTEQERLSVAKYCVNRVDGRVPVIVGAGGNDTATSVKTAGKMCDAGADALLVVTPYYNRPTQDGLVRHFTAVADASSVPVMMYNVPKRTGVNMLPETARRLKCHPRIVAYKEASDSIEQLAKDVTLLSPEIDVYAGNDGMTLAALAVGAKGVVSVAANVDPWSVAALCEAFNLGDTDMAQELQSRISHLSAALFCESSPIPCKAALELLGFPVGLPRLPLTPITDAAREFLALTLRELGLR